MISINQRLMLIDGKQIAAEITAELKKRSKPRGFLAAFLVGENPASVSFLNQKKKIADELGVDFRIYRLTMSINSDALRKEVLKIAEHKNCGGAIVQLPLPASINPQYVLNAIPREKDVDVLGERALGAFYAGRNPVLPPAVGVAETIIRKTRMCPNMPNAAHTDTPKIVQKELSYKLTGMFFKLQNDLGRFCRERQYADAFEALLKEEQLLYRRERSLPIAGRASNFADFIIEDKVLVELKSKPINTKEDYMQVKRYLETANLELGLLVNFRLEYLKPKRVLNPRFAGLENQADSMNSDIFVDSDYGTVAVVGLGALVGQPVSTWLQGKCREIYLLDKGSDFGVLKNADIVVCGAGVPGLVKPEMLKEGALVIDFGYGLKDGKPSGDFDSSSLQIENCKLKIDWTPTPGGTGPILVAKLFENFYKLDADKR